MGVSHTSVSMKSFLVASLLLSLAILGRAADTVSTKVGPSVKAPFPIWAPPVYADPPAYPQHPQYTYPGHHHHVPVYGGYQQQSLAYGANYQGIYQGNQIPAQSPGHHGIYGNSFYSPYTVLKNAKTD